MTAIVVTGASGLLGRALCAELVRQGREVIAVSRSGASIPGTQTAAVRDYSETPAPAGSTCVHLAGENVAAAVNVDEPGKTGDATSLVRTLLQKQFQRFLLVSSAAVYGTSSAKSHDEGGEARPDTPYGRMKLAGEREAMKDRRSVVARVTNAYGQGMPGANVLSGILRQLGSDKPLHLHNLTSVRDYIHVSDVARALVLLTGPAEPGIYNVSTGVGTSVGRLLETALLLAGQQERTVSVEMPGAPPSHLVLQPAKLLRLGWKPEISLRDGLERLIRKKE